jgi:hypothetical protein
MFFMKKKRILKLHELNISIGYTQMMNIPLKKNQPKIKKTSFLSLKCIIQQLKKRTT